MATVKHTRSKPKAVKGALVLARIVGLLPATNLLLDYDEEADVLYLSLQHPQRATRTIEYGDGDVVLHYRGSQLVGITVLDASKQ